MRISLSAHIEELRHRVLLILLAFFTVFVLVLLFIFPLFSFILSSFPPGITYAALSPFEAFSVQLRIAAFLSIGLTSPLWVYQLIAFVSPGLTHRERSGILFILPGVLFLFICGFFLSFFLLVPFCLKMLSVMAEGMQLSNVWGIGSVVGFSFWISVLVGVMFELPIALLLLSRIGVLESMHVSLIRPQVYVGAFIGAALITPPDMITQLIIGLMAILVYEVSVYLVRVCS